MSRGLLVAGAVLALAAACPVAAAEPADLVLHGARVHTLDARQPTAEAVAVATGRVVFVGSSAGARAYTGASTEVVDLGGKVLLPGLTDAHVHPAWGEFLLRRLCNVQSFGNAEGLRKLADCARNAPPGDWVVAYGWYMTDNPHLDRVSLAELDAIAPERNLVVIARDHHTFWVNSRTLATLGVTRETPDPAGGSYGRDPGTGALTGRLHDAANRPLTAMIHRESSYAADTASLYATAIPYLNSLGVTALLDALVDDDAEAAYRALEARGELTAKVSLAFAATAADYRSEIPRIAAKRATQSGRVRIDYVKLFADGNLEDGLAFMLGPDGKPDPATRGYFTQAQMDEVVALAEQHGLSVFVHVIGDAAARQVLDAIERARERGPCGHCRHTLTHLQWVHPDDRARFARLNVTANIQEAWIAPRIFGGPPGFDYARWLGTTAAGAAVAQAMFPYRSLYEAGARLAAGSDWFFTDENPWRAMAMGATSRDLDAPDVAPMLPGQVLEVRTLLEAHVAGGAWQMRQQTGGRIAAGAPADFVVVDRDVLAVTPYELAQTRVLSTWVDGRCVWSRTGGSGG